MIHISINQKTMFKCKYCSGVNEYNVFMPHPNTRRQWIADPAYSFHIKSVCGDCHKYNGFKKQTDELMKQLRGAVMVKLDLSERE